MNKYVIGVDPGNSGALCVLTAAGEYVDHLYMPTVKVGKAKRVNAAAVTDFIKKYHEKIKHCYLERVHAMPGQGVSSMFSFGHSAGIVEGVVVALGIPLKLVTPQFWKKKAGLIGQDKDAARSRAIQLYPELRALDLKGKGQALADSILIAMSQIL